MPYPFDELQFFRDPKDRESYVTADNRHYPIVIFRPESIWSEGTVEYYFHKWRNPILDYAVSQGEKVVPMLDLTKSKTPPATLRKQAGDEASGDKEHPGLVKTVCVVTSPVLRGVMTALVWIAGTENVPIAFLSTYPEALRLALEELEMAGVSKLPDIDPDTYTFPDIPEP